MKTAVSIPDLLFEEADRLAERLGTTRSHLYARALKAYIVKRRRPDITEQLNRVYAQAPSEFDPIVEAFQWASIPREPW